MCLRSQSTLRTGLNDVPAVRCMVGCTVVVPLAQCIHPLQPVYLSTDPTIQLDFDGGAQSGESYSRTLSHSLRCGLMHHRPRVCGRSACTINAHDSSCIRNTGGNPVRKSYPASKLKERKRHGTLLLRDGDISFPFPSLASNYGRNWLAPPKVVAVAFEPFRPL